MIPRQRLTHQHAGIASLTRRFMFIATVLAMTAVPALAQGVPRAFRGLFAVNEDPAAPRHRLDLGANLFAGAVQMDVEGAALGDQQLLEASYQGLSPVMTYAFRGRITSFESISGATFQHYSTLKDFRATQLYQRLQFGARVRPRTNITVSTRAYYSPYYTFAASADPEAEEGELVANGQPSLLAVRENLRLDAQVAISHRPSPRSEIAADYAIANTTFRNEGYDLATHRAAVRYSRGLTEHARLQLGYVYHQWQYLGIPGPTLRGHDVRAGIGYNRALTSAPRTRFGFDFGSVLAQQPGTVGVDVTGTAFLARQLSPAWSTAATYSRGLDVHAGFVELLYYSSDTAALSLTGTIARRAAVRFVGSYVRGKFSADVLENRAHSWNGTAGVNLTVASVVALHAAATFSTSRFSPRLGSVTGLPTFVGGFAVVSGLTIWLPVLR